MSRRALLLLVLATGGCQSATEATRSPVGDGKADDTAALQSLLDRGGRVTLARGTYRITKPLVIDLPKTGFTHVEGGTVARIVMNGDGPAFRFVGTHAGTAAPNSVKPTVWERERMPGIDGVEVVGDHPTADAVEAAGTMQLTVTRLLVRHCRHGVHLVGRNRNVLIADSHIYENRGVGVYLDNVNLHQINVTGSHISYNDAGGVVVRGGEVRNLHVTGCDIESNHGKAHPPTANVLIDNTGGSNAEVAITGCTIQHNHHAAGSANIRILGPANPSPVTTERREGHVTITGNVLSDVMVNVHLVHARGVVLTGNTFWTAYEHNILAEHSAHLVVGPNNFDRNPRYAREEVPTTANDLVFRDCADSTLTGLHISGVRAAAAAVTLEGCDRFHVTGLTILDCDGVGLLLKGVTRSRVGPGLIRDDRPGAKFTPIRTEGGSGNVIAE